MSHSVLQLSCPVCDEKLVRNVKTLTCCKKHSFDIAREGYVNLLLNAPPKSAQYSQQMIQQRDAFLGKHYYGPLVDKLLQLIDSNLQNSQNIITLCDAGCGSGYYLRQVATYLDDEKTQNILYGLDISRDAVRFAAKRQPTATFAVADLTKKIVLENNCIDVLFSLFSPRNPSEFCRVLKKPAGMLIVAMAGERHLGSLRNKLALLDVEPGKLERTRDQLSPFFDLSSESLEFDIDLSSADAQQLLSMSPNAFHQEKQHWEILSTQESWKVEVHVEILVGRVKG